MARTTGSHSDITGPRVRAAALRLFARGGYAAVSMRAIAAEVGGGLALVLGLYTRWVSLALVPVLLGAAWVHLGNGWVFSNPGGGWEFPVFWAVALLVQAGLGSGSFVISRRLA